MKYNTEEERLDHGLCPVCEYELSKKSQFNKNARCKKCGWQDVDWF